MTDSPSSPEAEHDFVSLRDIARLSARDASQAARTPPPASDDVVERVARAIDPEVWALRDADLARRDEWERGIKIGWSDKTFEEWANRFVGKSIEQAKAAIASLQDEVSRWQPIETAPKDGSIVWAASEGSMCPAYFYCDAWRNWYKGPRYENVKLGNHAYAPEEIWFEPTHWQPMPKPPRTALTPNPCGQGGGVSLASPL